ncbi:MAG TPA: 50S ribosomal protein L11 methyltransferase [Pseudomonadota bacterium]|nr:50S ribosomal protein L11 methyltransferase [Pseudomonadota bacterium]
MRYCEIKIELASEEKAAVHTLLLKRQLSFQEADASTLDPPPEGRTRYFLYLADEERGQIPPLVEAVRKVVPQAEIDVRDRDEEEWRDVWKKYFTTRRIGRLAIVPSWEVAAHEPADDEITLHLEPGRAFGTGGHESTRLCMLLLERLLARFRYRVGLFSRLADRLSPRTVSVRAATRAPHLSVATPIAPETGSPASPQNPQIFDVGCGSGVLAITALRLFPEVAAVAIDVDPEAIEVTLENAVRNQVESRLRCDTTPLAQVPGRFAIVLANLTGPTLIELAAELAAHVDLGGVLIVAGILEAEVQTVQAAFLAQGLVETTRATEGEWASLEYLRVSGVAASTGPAPAASSSAAQT